MPSALKHIKHWQVPVAVLLGLWVAASPWIVGPSGDRTLVAADVVLGLALAAAAAGMGHPTKAARSAWIAAAFGLLVAASPWVLHYADQLKAAGNAAAAGLLATLLAAWIALLETDRDAWWNDKVAH
jgi:hypothetical protein